MSLTTVRTTTNTMVIMRQVLLLPDLCRHRSNKGLFNRVDQNWHN
jgi:hypothetical protein